MVTRMLDLVELQQVREQMIEKSEPYPKKIKTFFYRKEKTENFQVGDWVLKWDIVRQDKEKHGKFDSLWIGPFVIAQV